MKKSKVDEIIEEHNISHMKFNKLQAHVPPKLFLAYYFHVWARLIIDVCFTVYQFRIFIYKFIMPDSFMCSEFPCKGGSEAVDVVSFRHVFFAISLLSLARSMLC